MNSFDEKVQVIENSVTTEESLLKIFDEEQNEETRLAAAFVLITFKSNVRKAE